MRRRESGQTSVWSLTAWNTVTFQQDLCEMNTHISVSTLSHPADWHAIDWRTCHARVRKLQLRIAEATRQQQWRRVRELQRILTRSFSGKAVAVRRVTENTGKRTPGVDGKTWSTPDENGK